MLHQFTRISLAALCGGAIAGYGFTAHAQEEDMTEDDNMASDDMSGGDDMGGDDMGGDDMGGDDMGGDEAMASSSSAWPHAIRDRPLTLKKGMYSAGASVGFANKFEVIGLGLGGLWGASYGISDKLTVGAGYSLLLKEFEAKGALDIKAAYTYYEKGPLILTGTGTLNLDLLAETQALNVGVAYWYNIGEKLTVFGGGDQLSIGFTDPGPITLALPVTVGFQLDTKTFLQLGTTVGTISIKDSESVFIGDTTPLDFLATYSPSNTLDVYAGFGTDLSNEPGDSYTVTVGATYYGTK